MPGKEALREHKGFRYTQTTNGMGKPSIDIKSFAHEGVQWDTLLEYEGTGSGMEKLGQKAVRQIDVYLVLSGKVSKFAVLASEMVGDGDWSCHVAAITDDPHVALSAYEEEVEKMRTQMGISAPLMNSLYDFSSSMKKIFRDANELGQD